MSNLKKTLKYNDKIFKGYFKYSQQGIVVIQRLIMSIIINRLSLDKDLCFALCLRYPDTSFRIL